MKQQTISDVEEYSARKRKTKREGFFEIMGEIIPWEEWVAYIAPYYPSGRRGRPPKGIEKKSRWRVEYKQYADRKLVAELVAVLTFDCSQILGGLTKVVQRQISESINDRIAQLLGFVEEIPRLLRNMRKYQKN